jgi:hypothetical protein
VLGTSERRQVIYGQIFTAMLLNGLGFTGRTLHMYSEFFDDKPVSHLIGEGIEASRYIVIVHPESKVALLYLGTLNYSYEGLFEPTP